MSKPPPESITNAAVNSILDPDYYSWTSRDQLLKLFLVLTLTEESMLVIIGCKTSYDVWMALSNAYSHGSKARELSLKDNLLSTMHSTQSVVDYGRCFKYLCDQLAAIGRPIDETDKSHWFLRGLGTTFLNFTAAQMS